MDDDGPGSPPPSSAIPRPPRSKMGDSSDNADSDEYEASDDTEASDEYEAMPLSIPCIPEWENFEDSEGGLPSWVPDVPTLSELSPEPTEELCSDEVESHACGKLHHKEGPAKVEKDAAEAGLKDAAEAGTKDDAEARTKDDTETGTKDDAETGKGNESSDFEEIDPNDMRIWDSDTEEELIDDRGAYRRSKKVIKMDPVYDYDGKKFSIIEGQEIKFEVRHWFTNAVEVRNAVRDYAVRHGYKLRFIKNDSKRITVACFGSCPWRMHTSVLNGQQKFMVKTLNDSHTFMKIKSGYWATPKWIARQIDNLLQANNNLDNDTLKAALKKIGCTPQDWKLYKAKSMHKLNTYGTYVESYAKLHIYCEKLRALNPGSVVILEGLPRANTSDRLKFGRVFVCLGGVKDGFINGCRPFLGLDGCHLKGPFGGTLLAAVSRDANSKILPVAWAVVDKENGANWEWFIHLLYTAVGSHASGKALTVITDGQKGLGDQIEAFLPNSRTRRCVKHIAANFFQTYRGIDLEHWFWGMVYATTRTRFNRKMAELKLKKFPAKKVGKEMLTPPQWLEKIPPEKWSVHAFDEYVKCMDVTNNLVESFNNWVGKLRGLPVVDLLDGLRVKMMRKWNSRFVMAYNCETSCVPVVMAQLRQLSEECRTCEIIPTRNFQYEVMHEGVREVVDLVAKKCTCNVWQLSGIPCIHIAAVFTAGEGDMVNWVHQYCKVEKWQKTYEYHIYPFPDAELDPIDGDHPIYHPPFLTRRAGRPRKHNRKRQDGERRPVPRSNSIKCATCGVMGHNKRSCMGAQTKRKGKQPMEATGTAAKSRRQRPRKKKGVDGPSHVIQEAAEGRSQPMQTGAEEVMQEAAEAGSQPVEVGAAEVMQGSEGGSQPTQGTGAYSPTVRKYVSRRGRGRGIKRERV